MDRYTLTPKPLTAEAFAPFGDVVQCDGNTPMMINDGNTERYHNLVSTEVENADDKIIINIFRAQPRSLPMTICMMERHPKGSQSFQPLSGEEYLVLVGDPVEDLKPENLHLFLATKDQGVNYRKNTWHHPVLGLHKVCDFLVVDRLGEGHNCEEIYFGDNVNIEITLEL
ncbi:ureidoglycolate hydrolase [Oleiphilus sp. HI0118]|nr:ureidoglycolate hydrolase [Oleiphilus sp. HI0118]KZZ44880.1 ureidoglycolate hydrolase [Oleiphilus sp. HI0118]